MPSVVKHDLRRLDSGGGGTDWHYQGICSRSSTSEDRKLAQAEERMRESGAWMDF